MRVYRLNRDAVVTELRRRAGHLQRARAEVVDVRLFGSLARGRAVPGSDADLLLVLSDSTEPFLDRAPRYAAYFDGAGIGVDVFAYTRAEMETMRSAGNTFAARAMAEGVSLVAPAAA